eukprot:4562880-Prymnesium_polylepis.1
MFSRHGSKGQNSPPFSWGRGRTAAHAVCAARLCEEEEEAVVRGNQCMPPPPGEYAVMRRE